VFPKIIFHLIETETLKELMNTKSSHLKNLSTRIPFSLLPFLSFPFLYLSIKMTDLAAPLVHFILYMLHMLLSGAEFYPRCTFDFN
jgi:hypothetical protein